MITQYTHGVPGNNQIEDRFGFAVAVGRLDRDRYADIVIGAPGKTTDRPHHDHPPVIGHHWAPRV